MSFGITWNRSLALILILFLALGGLVACSEAPSSPEASGAESTSANDTSSDAAPSSEEGESGEPVFKDDFESGDAAEWEEPQEGTAAEDADEEGGGEE